MEHKTGYPNKMLTWEKLTGKNVDFKSDLVCSTVTYWFSDQVSGQAGDQVSEQIQILVNAIRENVYSKQKKYKISNKILIYKNKMLSLPNKTR